MKKSIILLWVAFWLSGCSRLVTHAFLQPDGATVLPNDAARKTSPCGDVLNYAPDSLHPEQTPKRYIRVRFCFVRHDENDKGFDLEKSRACAKMLVDEANYRLEHNQKMSLPIGNNTPVLPINYRYVIYPNPHDPNDDGVQVIYDTALAYFNTKGSVNGFYDSHIYQAHGIQKDTVLNIFVLQHQPDSLKSASYRASMQGVGFPQWLKLVGAYEFIDPPTRDATGQWHFANSHGMAALMNHELGHSMGLLHSWMGDGCDDTPNNPNCWDQNSSACKETGVFSNNMMDYNNSQQALTPCQIGKVQYNMAYDNSTQRKLLMPNWCDYKADSTIYIDESTVWNGAHDLEGDVVVGNGDTLTIQCRVSLPKGAKVVVKPKGVLVVDGGLLTNLCGDQWLGIEIWANKKSKGQVFVKSGGQIIHTKPYVNP